MYKSYVKPIDLLNENDLNKIGGKGKSIYFLYKNNFNVPKSFYILEDVFKLMVKQTGISKDINKILLVNKNDLLKLKSISEIIVKKIMNYQIPSSLKNVIYTNINKINNKYIVVRSSAIAEDSLNKSWAGILESYLYTDETNIFTNLLKCWSSLFEIRSLIYFKMNSNDIHDLSMSIVIQEMINSKLSGVCFTIDPVFNDQQKIVIDYCNDLCCNIADGSIISKQYIFDKYSFKLIDGNINLVEYSQITNLINYFIQIEKLFKFPQDIEWCIQNEKLYILQSRPISTITNN